jgi:hypothetical protein
VKKTCFLLALTTIICCCALTGTAAAQPKLPGGFIALSGANMNWADAQVWCEEQGGKLPLINNSDSWNGKDPSKDNIRIDGFGNVDGSWPSGLPIDDYWTGTMVTDLPGSSWVIFDCVGMVDVSPLPQSIDKRVVCVPK